MRKNLKSIGLILVFIISLVYLSCHTDETFKEGETAARDMAFNGEICDGKKILRFNSLTELQQAHMQLFQLYEAGNQEEQILIDYEDSHNFYSLRKKEQDMDNGVIPYDATFDETNFTLDPILETLLNQDGMIIIGERLYIWDTGCLIQSIPFSCSNYGKLLDFYNAAKTNSINVMHNIFISNQMKNTNTCDDTNYDFETISENRGKVEPSRFKTKNKNGCGYEVVVNSTLKSCTEEWNTYEISFEKIEPLNSGNALNFYYVSSAFGDLDALEFSNALTGSYASIPIGNEDETYGYVIPFTGTFYMRIPAGDINTFSISLVSSIKLLQGNSCQASDSVAIDNNCPFTITADKGNVNSSQATWTFSIPTTNGCPIGQGKVTWDFGDGTIVTGGPSIIHVYSMPCKMQHLTVTAIIGGVTCGMTDKVLSKGNIPYGNPCMRQNYKFPSKSAQWSGKKAKFSAKIKTNNSGKVKIVNLLKCRITGTKIIKSTGSIYNPSANNGSCQQANIASVMGIKSTNGKKRNKQKERFGSLYHINAEDPYKVIFSHSNGHNYILTADDLYCSQ